MALTFEIIEKGEKRYYQMDDTQVTIGRSADCDIVLDDDSVSGVHCQLTLSDRSLFLQDLKSKNGTRVGQNQVKGKERRQIFIDDVIQVGGHSLRLIPRDMTVVEQSAFRKSSSPRRETDLTLSNIKDN